MAESLLPCNFPKCVYNIGFDVMKNNFVVFEFRIEVSSAHFCSKFPPQKIRSLVQGSKYLAGERIVPPVKDRSSGSQMNEERGQKRIYSCAVIA